jgi:hypothetical protein
VVPGQAMARALAPDSCEDQAERKGEFMIKELDYILRFLNPYPKMIILGEKSLENLVNEFKKNRTYGLKVNLKNEPVEIWGMRIKIDKENPYTFIISKDEV